MKTSILTEPSRAEHGPSDSNADEVRLESHPAWPWWFLVYSPFWGLVLGPQVHTSKTLDEDLMSLSGLEDHPEEDKCNLPHHTGGARHE